MAKNIKKKEMSKSQAVESDMPMFYKNPVALDKGAHGKSGLKAESDSYKFAKESNSVPITIVEFIEVAKSYPIVFSLGDNPVPVCILGLENNDNLFVSKSGTWEKNLYVPAYIRRYPFILSENSDNSRLILCIDEKAGSFVKKAAKGDVRLFDGKGMQSELLNHKVAFCSQYHKDFIESQNFCRELKSRGVLADRELNVNLPNKKEPFVFSGFQVVDEDVLRNLPSDVVQDWHKRGLLSLVYSHLFSQSNWKNLVARFK